MKLVFHLTYTVMHESTKLKLDLCLSVNPIIPCQAHIFSLQSSILILSYNFRNMGSERFLPARCCMQLFSGSVVSPMSAACPRSHSIERYKCWSPSSCLAPKTAISAVTVRQAGRQAGSRYSPQGKLHFGGLWFRLVLCFAFLQRACGFRAAAFRNWLTDWLTD